MDDTMAFKRIIAGDSYKQTISDERYPASEWSLKYFLSGPGSVVVDAVPDGSAFSLVLSANQTAALKPGLYESSLRFWNSNETHTESSGVVTVTANPASGGREFIAQRMIELIERCLLGQLTEGEAVEALSIGGRSLTLVNRTELLDERNRWHRELAAYKRAKTGQSSIRQIRLGVGRL